MFFRLLKGLEIPPGMNRACHAPHWVNLHKARLGLGLRRCPPNTPALICRLKGDHLLGLPLRNRTTLQRFEVLFLGFPGVHPDAAMADGRAAPR